MCIDKNISSINNFVRNLTLSTWINNPNIVFRTFLAVFLLDSLTNYFQHTPIFVPFSILFLPLIWLNLFYSGGFKRLLLVIAILFSTSFLINTLIWGYHKNNVSDLVFILYLPTSYFYYRIHQQKLTKTSVYVFFAVSFFMISFSFLGYNSRSYNINVNDLSSYEIGLSDERVIDKPKSDLNFVENNRSFNYGLFRIPHIASYFFGFLLLFYSQDFIRRQKIILLLPIGFLIFILLFTGVRTFLVALIFGLMISLLNRKYLIYLFSLLLFFSLVLLLRFDLFNLTSDTFLRPYTSLLITAVDNFGRLSRIMIWRSWWLEFSQFGWYEFFIGKSYFSSILSNLRNLHSGIWFHNDFLSIIYSYGVPAFLAYLMIFAKIFRDNRLQITKQMMNSIFYWAMVISACFNGLYNYFPLFFMFVFLVMTREEKAV